jgi:hypothetical protein
VYVNFKAGKRSPKILKSPAKLFKKIVEVMKEDNLPDKEVEDEKVWKTNGEEDMFSSGILTPAASSNSLLKKDSGLLRRTSSSQSNHGASRKQLHSLKSIVGTMLGAKDKEGEKSVASKVEVDIERRRKTLSRITSLRTLASDPNQALKKVSFNKKTSFAIKM